MNKVDHLNFYPRPKWKMSRVLSQLKATLSSEAAWAGFVKLYGYYAKIEAQLDAEAKTGVTVYNGFQRDFTRLLQWHCEQPNYWFRRENEPLDEGDNLTAFEQSRIELMRKQVTTMKSLYQRLVEDLYVSSYLNYN